MPVCNSAAMSLFILPAAASNTIFARKTNLAGTRRPRVQRLSVSRSASETTIA